MGCRQRSSRAAFGARTKPWSGIIRQGIDTVAVRAIVGPAGRAGRHGEIAMAERGPRRSNAGIGLAIIVIGGVLLLGSLDLFADHFWSNLAALWPLGVIAIGVYMLLNRSHWMAANAALGVLLVGGAIAAASLSAADVDLGGPDFDFGNWGFGERGSGHAAADERNLRGFDHVKVEGSDRIEIRIGPAQSVTVHSDDNLLDFIRTDVIDDRLSISRSHSISPDAETYVAITVPDLAMVELSGSGEVEIAGLSGGGLEIAVSGSGDVNAAGRVDDLKVTLSGSGDIDTTELDAADVAVRISGSGDVRVHAIDSLDITVNGSGDLRYSGNPDVNQTVNGSGSVKHDD
jgi:hypothetical protein